MPLDLTETSTFDTVVTVPVTGEPRTALSVRTGFQSLANRSRWTNGALNGLLVGRRELYTNAAGSATDVFVAPIARLVLGSRVLSTSAATEAPTPGGGLAAETWYYVYAYDSSGVLALETTTSAPEATLTWKTGTTTHRYLGCFRTSTGGSPTALPFRSLDGRFLFRASSTDAATELRVLGTASAVSATDLIVARDGTATRELLPPHARIAHLRSQLTATGGEATAVYNTKGDSGVTIRQEHADGMQSSIQFPIETDSSRTIQYTLTLGSTGGLNILCVGFEE